jgi:serine/threonine protein kinase
VKAPIVFPSYLAIGELVLTSQQQDHILGLLGTAGFDGHKWGEIFMPLKQGSVKSLVKEIPPHDIPALASRVMIHMLRALRTLAHHRIIHRDIKPENILYDIRANDYHFELGDFGLSNEKMSAKTQAGTETFMAPEVYSGGEQTTKIDIWSLFVTIIWIHDVEGFREVTAYEKAPQVHNRLRDIAARYPQFQAFKDMVNKVPDRRPAAKKLLKTLGDGEEHELLVQDINNMTLEDAPGTFAGQNLSGDEAENLEYSLQRQYPYSMGGGETSTMGAQFGDIPRDTDSGPVYYSPFLALNLGMMSCLIPVYTNFILSRPIRAIQADFSGRHSVRPRPVTKAQVPLFLTNRPCELTARPRATNHPRRIRSIATNEDFMQPGVTWRKASIRFPSQSGTMLNGTA